MRGPFLVRRSTTWRSLVGRLPGCRAGWISECFRASFGSVIVRLRSEGCPYQSCKWPSRFCLMGRSLGGSEGSGSLDGAGGGARKERSKRGEGQGGTGKEEFLICLWEGMKEVTSSALAWLKGSGMGQRRPLSLNGGIEVSAIKGSR